MARMVTGSVADSVETSAPGAAGAWSTGKSAVSEKKKKKLAGGADAVSAERNVAGRGVRVTKCCAGTTWGGAVMT